MDGYGETALIAWIMTFMFIGAYLLGFYGGATEEKADLKEALTWSRASFIAMTIGIVIWFIVFW